MRAWPSVASRTTPNSPPLNLDEYERAARQILPAASYDWIAGGAEDELTLAENRAAFRRRVLRYRVLRDVGRRDLSVGLLGGSLRYPILLAPTAVHRLAHADGELATARGAAAAEALYVVSTSASMTLEDIAAAAPGARRWFQLYTFGGLDHTRSLIRRARAAGYEALVVTVDLPVLGRRERDLRNTFEFPARVELVHEAPYETRAPERTLVWEDLAWMRAAWGAAPLILKGIVRGDDAATALARGADAVWVSNHGGRQLDTAIATLDALPEVVAAVAGRAPVIVDGGIRRGTDVIKALALGATAVAIGRPYLYGLAVGGADGVRAVVERLRDELDVSLALVGCRSLAEVTPDLVR